VGSTREASGGRKHWEAVGSGLILKNNDLCDDQDAGSLRFRLRQGYAGQAARCRAGACADAHPAGTGYAKRATPARNASHSDAGGLTRIARDSPVPPTRGTAFSGCTATPSRARINY
jgi:hypothetical protein